MKIANNEKTLREVRRLTQLARETDDGILRADYYRLAQQSREHRVTALPQIDGPSVATQPKPPAI
jgi:hypothetical protein